MTWKNNRKIKQNIILGKIEKNLDVWIKIHKMIRTQEKSERETKKMRLTQK